MPQVPWTELVGRIAFLTFTQHGSIALQVPAQIMDCPPDFMALITSDCVHNALSAHTRTRHGSIALQVPARTRNQRDGARPHRWRGPV